MQYYFFTPVDDFVNEHEGDWENVTVYVNKTEADKIYAIEYMFHHFWLRIRNKPENAGIIDIVNNHPILYSGGTASNMFGSGNGSHGIFPYPANFQKVEVLSGSNETIDGQKKIIYWKQFNIEFVLENSGQNDFYYPAYWGNGTDNSLSDNQVIDGAANFFVGVQKSPYTRSLSTRWKKKATGFTEDALYMEDWPTRENTIAKDKVIKNPNGLKSIMQSILSLLLD